MLNIPSAISSVCIKGKQLIKLAFLEDVNFSFCGTFEYVFPVMLWQCEKRGAILNSGFMYTMNIFTWDQCVLF